MTGVSANNRAIAYVRVSSARQVDEGNSIASQTASIRQYAKGRGLRLLSRDIVIDEGVSGGIPLWDRPGGRLLMKRVESGKFGHLIAMKLDRLFRITSDAIHTVDELHDEGIGLHVINLGGQSMDTSTSMGRFFFQIVASFAELERGLISERTREGMAYLKDNHMRFTRSMYGWDVREDGGIKPNWKEQNHIDYMVWMMKDGMSAHSIARANNEKGKLGKNGGKWSSETVLSVTRNEYHRERVKFDAPKSWGTRVWQRRRRGDEKVEAKVVTDVWDKGDL